MSSTQSQPRQSDLAVMEANEYKQKRRLREILETRKQVKEDAKRAYELYAQQQISNEGRNILLLQAVKEFIREVYVLIDEYDDQLEDGEWNEYWNGPEVQQKQIPKPGGGTTTIPVRTGSPLGRIERVQDDDIVFWGLKNVLEANEVYYEEWTEAESARHGPSSNFTKTTQHVVPAEVCWNAYLLVLEFLGKEKDLKVQFESNSLPEDHI